MTSEMAPSPTPILDRQALMPPPAPPRKSSVTGWVVWFVSVFVFSIVFTLWRPPGLQAFWRWVGSVIAALALPGTFPGLAVYALSFVVALFLAVALHETGHALAGIAAGFRFNTLRLGRVEIHRGFRLSLLRGRIAGGWFGGSAHLIPVRTDRMAERAIAMVAGGPVANLLTAFVILALPFTANRLTGFLVLFSLLLALTNLVPFRNQAAISDGARILMLLRSRGQGERWVALMKLMAEIVEGVPSERLSQPFIAKAIAVQDDSPDTVGAHAIAYSTAFYLHQDEEAARLLEVCLRYSSFVEPRTREALISDASIFHSRRRGDVVLAQEWLAILPAKTAIVGIRERAEAGILEAQGNLDGALAKLEESKRAVGEIPNAAQRDIFLRGLQRWQAELVAKARLAQGAEAAPADQPA